MKSSYTASKVMNMNRRDRRRLGSVNKVKIPSIINHPLPKKEKSKEETEAIEKILNENKKSAHEKISHQS